MGSSLVKDEAQPRCVEGGIVSLERTPIQSLALGSSVSLIDLWRRKRLNFVFGEAVLDAELLIPHLQGKDGKRQEPYYSTLVRHHPNYMHYSHGISGTG